jgi:hypothetical protein
VLRPVPAGHTTLHTLEFIPVHYVWSRAFPFCPRHNVFGFLRPNFKAIATTGGSPSKSPFEGAWSENKKLRMRSIDLHYYFSSSQVLILSWVFLPLQSPENIFLLFGRPNTGVITICCFFVWDQILPISYFMKYHNSPPR